MMSPPEEKGTAVPEEAEEADETKSQVEVPAEFIRQLRPLLDTYLALHTALSNDDSEEAARAAATFLADLEAVEMRLLESPSAHRAWMRLATGLRESAQKVKGAGEITAQRASFAGLSTEMVELVKRFGPLTEDALYVQRCPMAFGGRGARWLQTTKETRNPYYGAAMLSCGEVVETVGEETP
jgi:Cu(I)/Ag(I) efflux system membrane fusion protein